MGPSTFVPLVYHGIPIPDNAVRHALVRHALGLPVARRCRSPSPEPAVVVPLTAVPPPSFAIQLLRIVSRFTATVPGAPVVARASVRYSGLAASQP